MTDARSPLIARAADVRAHYDLSDDFFRLFLDESRTYSCAYFESDDATLEQAQLAKIDLSLSKLGLQPGMTLLDVGCGWGSTMRRAAERHDVHVIGLTLSENQHAYVEAELAGWDSDRSRRVELRGWEDFDEPVDRIVSIGAFEHFGFDRHAAFFDTAHRVLPDDGVMLLHTITRTGPAERDELGLPVTMRVLRFTKFIMDEIFPGGRLPEIGDVERDSAAAGFTVTRVQRLRPHYARTLEGWADTLRRRRDEAVALQSEQVYDRYMKYLTGCASLFREGYVDVCQFTLRR